MGVSFSRGSELDVLDRYAIAAETHGAETVVRVTSDCPLMDPAIIDELVDFYHKGVNGVPFDYVSNSLERKYPLGFEAEVFSTKALLQAHKSARLPAEREHVTVFIRNHPELFNLGSFCGADDAAHLRVTVDTEEDFRLIEKILGKIYLSNPSFTYQDVVTLLRNTPELVDINRHVIQKKAIS
jgi:spore coat polysaccharide biosynthesis protein SpsF